MAKIQKNSLDSGAENKDAGGVVAEPLIYTDLVALVATPDNTPVPGGGSWRWDYTQHAWVANTPDQPLQPGDIGALQTTEPNQE